MENNFSRNLEMLKTMTHSLKKPQNEDDVKINGISSCICKLLSPLLTCYGMTKETGEAKLLSEMGKGKIFDCSCLSNRAFLIDPAHLNIPGYGYDTTGSQHYLADTLRAIEQANEGDKRLVPIHVDGDGHCLVHAISRALVGRELFWHALRENLCLHFQNKLDSYKKHFKDFIHISEWQEIIDECKPDYVPPDGEPLGLGNIHIFGLANILRRPIVLLDSVFGMNSSADYSGVFLPTLWEKEDCFDKKLQQLNKPLCIAWSSSGRNHYIPLVGIEGKPSARLPRSMLQKAWGMPDDLIDKYIDFDENECCTIGGNKLSDKYIQKLTEAMEKVYFEVNQVQPRLVADTYQVIRRISDLDSLNPEKVLIICKELIQQEQLYRCLNCQRLNVKMQKEEEPTLNTNATTNALLFMLSEMNNTRCEDCKATRLRCVKADGDVRYLNGDMITSPLQGSKYYWNGVFYNLSQILPEAETLESSSGNSNDLEIGLQEHLSGDLNCELLGRILKDPTLTAAAALAATRSSIQPEDSLSLSGDNENPLDKIQNQRGSVAHTQTRSDTNDPKGSVPSQKSAITKQSLPSGSPTSSSSSSSTKKTIRFSTSSGQKISLTFDKDFTFEELQILIQKQFGIPVKNQKIKLGFPPQHLCPPRTQLVRLNHGDRLHIDIQQQQQFDGDPMKSLLIGAQLEGHKDVWSYVQQFPAFFHKGGIVYNQVRIQRDNQVQQRMKQQHFNIPFLPNKTFFYNASTDVVQICLRAYGHFNVVPNVELNVQELPAHSLRPCTYRITAQHPPTGRHGKSRPHFSGHGRSLMTRRQDVSKSSPRKKDLLTPSAVDESEHPKHSSSSSSSSYQRLGPGFSVLGGDVANATNMSLERMRNLVVNIDPHFDFGENQDDDDDDDDAKRMEIS